MMKSQLCFPLGFSLSILLALPNASLGPNPAVATQHPDRFQTSQQQADPPLPTPPPTPPPSGQRTPGGGLSGQNSGCPQTQLPLTALTPLNVQGVTLSQQPTFWFFLPYAPEEIQMGEFSLISPDETEQLYRFSFQLPQTPGLVSISWPDSVDFSLRQDQYYHWYLNLYCADNLTSRPDFSINGWVQRMTSTLQRQQQISNAAPDVWYDAIHRIALQLQSPDPDPETATLRQNWAQLLNSVGLDALITKPIIGPVIPIDGQSWQN